MVAERVEIEKIRNVNVLHAELIGFATIVSTARLVIVDFDSLNFEANVAVLDATIKLRIAVDKVDGGHMMRNQ